MADRNRFAAEAAAELRRIRGKLSQQEFARKLSEAGYPATSTQVSEWETGYKRLSGALLSAARWVTQDELREADVMPMSPPGTDPISALRKDLQRIHRLMTMHQARIKRVEMQVASLDELVRNVMDAEQAGPADQDAED